MIVNADFALKAVVHTQTMPWEKSPVEGVERKYLDRWVVKLRSQALLLNMLQILLLLAMLMEAVKKY